MKLLQILGLSNTPVNFQPTVFKRGTITPGIGIVLSDGNIIPEDSSGDFIQLPYSSTLWLNEGGDLNVIPTSGVMNTRVGVLFKNVQGDFHRSIKGIIYDSTTITDIVIDYMIPINTKKL